MSKRVASLKKIVRIIKNWKNIAKKLENEIRRTENTFLRASNFLWKDSVPYDTTNLDAAITPEDGSTGLVQLESDGLGSHQENFAAEDSFVGLQLNLHDSRFYW